MDAYRQVENVRAAYAEGQYEAILEQADRILKRIAADDQPAYCISEPQLSALLVMAIEYAKPRIKEF